MAGRFDPSQGRGGRGQEEWGREVRTFHTLTSEAPNLYFMLWITQPRLPAARGEKTTQVGMQEGVTGVHADPRVLTASVALPCPPLQRREILATMFQSTCRKLDHLCPRNKWHNGLWLCRVTMQRLPKKVENEKAHGRWTGVEELSDNSKKTYVTWFHPVPQSDITKHVHNFLNVYYSLPVSEGFN